ncbi:MAG TPA: cytochrome c peroxidase [Gemmatimonadales bacterium]|nr:cytochrome c peroxidase [Gemmatimonadales bacterium]
MRTHVIAAAATLAVVAACGRPAAERASVPIDPARLAAFAPLPRAIEAPDNPITPEKIALGRMLYYETRLSRDGDVSCNSCHSLADYGVDHNRVSTGVQNQLGSRNSPTVYNAAGHIAQFWDGRAATVEEQAKGPILNPVEMAMPSDQAVLAALAAIPEYRAAFRRAFPGEANPVTYDNVGRAIGAFERGLITPSRWDALLEGDAEALSPAERAGFNAFVEAGCSGCHGGTYVGGGSFQQVGLAEPWPALADSGRGNGVFKVPSLRNIAQTAPYFHDGATISLTESVYLMAHHQLGRRLTADEAAAIVTWLEALTGTIPESYISPPGRAGTGQNKSGGLGTF